VDSKSGIGVFSASTRLGAGSTAAGAGFGAAVAPMRVTGADETVADGGAILTAGALGGGTAGRATLGALTLTGGAFGAAFGAGETLAWGGTAFCVTGAGAAIDWRGLTAGRATLGAAPFSAEIETTCSSMGGEAAWRDGMALDSFTGGGARRTTSTASDSTGMVEGSMSACAGAASGLLAGVLAIGAAAGLGGAVTDGGTAEVFAVTEGTAAAFTARVTGAADATGATKGTEGACGTVVADVIGAGDVTGVA
jgi:hypothetical protein